MAGGAPPHRPVPWSASLREVAATPLAVGRVARLDAAGPPQRLFRIALGPGQLLHVLAEQQGLDVQLFLRGPSGRDLLSVDSPNSEHGPEHLYFIAGRAGPYVLEVRRLSAVRGGSCTIEIADLRPPLPADRDRAVACRLMSEADAGQEAASPAARRLGLGLYTQAVLAWRAAGETAAEAMAEIKLGNGWAHLGEMRSSVEHWERALTLLAECRLENSVPALQNDLGNGYQRLGDPSLARTAYEAALASARHLGDRREEAAALNNLGILDERAGDAWSALAYLDEALAGWRELGERSGEATTLENEGLSYTLVGKLVEARAALEQAAGMFRLEGDRRQEAESLVSLGWVRFLEGDAPAARGDLVRALALARAVGDRRGEAVALDRLGSLASGTNDFSQAVSCHRAALALFQAVGDQQSEAHATSNLGQALAQGGDAAAGLPLLDRAVERLGRLKEPSAEAYAHFRRARIERRLGRLEAARQDLEMGLTRIESIRDQAQSDDLRMTYLDSVHDQYELLVAILMDLHAGQPGAGFDRAALFAAERSRARGLLDLVVDARRRGPGIEGSAARRLRAVDESIRGAQALAPGANSAGSAAGTAAGDTRLRELLAERQRILVELRHGGVLAAEVPPILGDEQLEHRLLDDQTVLLVYALGDSQSFVWAVTEQGVASAILPPRATLEAAARRVHLLLAETLLVHARLQAALSVRELSNVLLGPVAAQIAGRRVAVVVDGTLGYVPFAALPEPGGDDTPLIVHHEVVVLPSASVLAAIRERVARRAPAPQLLAVLADPLLRPADAPPPTPGDGLGTALTRGPRDLPSDGAATRSMHDLGLVRLDPLPFSRQEAKAILAFAPAAEELGAVGAAANRNLVVDGHLERFRILHFATHALIHPSVPELSGIVLASTDRQGRPQPGFLQSYEIADLRLPAELVVLSACRSGLGKELKGEGLYGLTQSFFDAGATRVLVSLWDVGDEPTARLMEIFYRKLLQERLTPAAALRAAQVALRLDPRWAAPYFWAGFELEGDWRPLR
jgi:CHAT domain-containing protein/tetratricopeptide (TPR) repeat protein